MTNLPCSNRNYFNLHFLNQGGHYTVIVRGKKRTTGVAVVEVYDLGTCFDTSCNAELANISKRGLMQTGER